MTTQLVSQARQSILNLLDLSSRGSPLDPTNQKISAEIGQIIAYVAQASQTSTLGNPSYSFYNDPEIAKQLSNPYFYTDISVLLVIFADSNETYRQAVAEESAVSITTPQELANQKEEYETQKQKFQDRIAAQAQHNRELLEKLRRTLPSAQSHQLDQVIQAVETHVSQTPLPTSFPPDVTPLLTTEVTLGSLQALSAHPSLDSREAVATVAHAINTNPFFTFAPPPETASIQTMTRLSEILPPLSENTPGTPLFFQNPSFSHSVSNAIPPSPTPAVSATQEEEVYIYFIDPVTRQPVDIGNRISPRLAPFLALSRQDTEDTLVQAAIPPHQRGKGLPEETFIRNQTAPAIQLLASSLGPQQLEAVLKHPLVTSSPHLLSAITSVRDTQLDLQHGRLARQTPRAINQAIRFSDQLFTDPSRRLRRLRILVTTSALKTAEDQSETSHLKLSVSSGGRLEVANHHSGLVTTRINSLFAPHTTRALVWGLNRISPRLGTQLIAKYAAGKAAQTALLQSAKIAAAKTATALASKAGLSLAISLGAEAAVPVVGWVVAALQLTYEGAKWLGKKIYKFFNNITHTLFGVTLKKASAKTIFTGSTGISLLGLALIAGGVPMLGIPLLVLGIGGILLSTKGNFSSDDFIFLSSIGSLFSLLIKAPLINVAFVISSIFISVVVFTLIVIFTAHSSFFTPLTKPSSMIGPPGILPGSVPGECQGNGVKKPSATGVFFSIDGNYAFPMAPFSTTYYGCSHWDGFKSTDIGIIGDTAANPPKGAHLPIIAYTSGYIESVSLTDSIGGKYIILNGHDGRFYYYAHNCAIYVKSGDQVKVGDVIATSDNSGSAATTVEHVHFAINSSSFFKGGDGDTCPSTDFAEKFGLDRCIPQTQCK